MKHILFIDDAHTFGGAQIALVNSLAALDAENKFKLSVVVSKKNKRLVSMLLKMPDINLILGPGAYPLNIFFFYLNIISVKKVFNLSALNSIDFCVLNLSGIEFNLTYLFYLKKNRVAMAGWLHCAKRFSSLMPKASRKRKIINHIRDALAEKFIIKIYKSIYAPSQAEKNILIKRVPRLKTKPYFGVLYNAISAEKYSSKTSIPDAAAFLNNKHLTIAVIGEINFSIKGQDRTINLALELIKKGITPYFIFIGDGRDANLLSNLFINSNLEMCFEITGWKQDISKWLQMSTIVLITSRIESFSLVAVEAMIMGKRIIANKLDCFDEVLPAECVSDIELVDSFLDAIERIVSLDDDYIKKIYSPYIKKFSPNEFVKTFQNIMYID